MVCWRQLRAWKPPHKGKRPAQGSELPIFAFDLSLQLNKQERPMLASRAAQQLDTSHQNKRRGERHEQKLFYIPSAP